MDEINFSEITKVNMTFRVYCNWDWMEDETCPICQKYNTPNWQNQLTLTLVVLNTVFETQICMRFIIPSRPGLRRQIIFRHGRQRFGQDHYCWWPGDKMNMGILIPTLTEFSRNIPIVAREGLKAVHTRVRYVACGFQYLNSYRTLLAKYLPNDINIAWQTECMPLSSQRYYLKGV